MSSQTNNFRKDFSDAAKYFDLIRGPIEKLIGPTIYSTELDSNKIDIVDIEYGYDLIQIDNEGLINGIALRIQYIDKSYNTFTLRYTRSTGSETEVSKRIKAIANNGKYPKWTIQIYINDNTIIGLGIVDTKLLYEKVALFIVCGLDRDYTKDVYINVNPIDGNEFIVVKWHSLREVGKFSDICH